VMVHFYGYRSLGVIDLLYSFEPVWNLEFEISEKA